MTPEQVLALKPKVLTQQQREFYFENGKCLNVNVTKEVRFDVPRFPHQINAIFRVGGLIGYPRVTR